jgi:hypothetical protein
MKTKCFSNNFIIIFLLLCLNTHQELLSTFSLFRHSARNELKFDSFIEDELSNYGKGELTGMGFAMSIEKGKLYRERYSEMGFNVSPKDVTVISTPVQRTIYTAYTFIKGYFSDTDLDIDFNSIGNQGNKTQTIIDSKIDSLDPYREMFLKAEQVEKPLTFPLNVISKQNRMFFKMKCVEVDTTEKSVLNDGAKLNIQTDWEVLKNVSTMYPGIFEYFCTNVSEVKQQGNCLEDDTNTENRRQFVLYLAGFYEILEFYRVKDIDDQMVNLAVKYYIADRYNYGKEGIVKQGTLNFRLLHEFFSTDCGEYKINEHFSFENSILDILNKIKCQKQVMMFTHDDILTQTVRNLFDFKNDLLQLVNNDKSFHENKESFHLYWPPFLSEFTYELHLINNEKFIKIFINQKEMDKASYYKYKNRQNNIVYTDKGIPLENFLGYLKARIDLTASYFNEDC